MGAVHSCILHEWVILPTQQSWRRSRRAPGEIAIFLEPASSYLQNLHSALSCILMWVCIRLVKTNIPLWNMSWLSNVHRVSRCTFNELLTASLQYWNRSAGYRCISSSSISSTMGMPEMLVTSIVEKLLWVFSSNLDFDGVRIADIDDYGPIISLGKESISQYVLVLTVRWVRYKLPWSRAFSLRMHPSVISLIFSPAYD